GGIVQEWHRRIRTAQHVRVVRRLMTGGASGFVAEQALAPTGGGLVEAAFRRLRRAQAELICQQRRQLGGHQIRRLRYVEPDARIAEIAVASPSAGDSATIAPTFRSVLAHPSRRLPMPGANESSTDEWHSAHVMPTFVS